MITHDTANRDPYRDTRAWLGPAADEHNEDEIAQLDATFGHIAARYPDPDDEDEREAARATAHRLMVEPVDDVVDDLAADLSRARTTQADTVAALRAAARITLPPDQRTSRGIAEFAGWAGVDPATVRDWLGSRVRPGRRPAPADEVDQDVLDTITEQLRVEPPRVVVTRLGTARTSALLAELRALAALRQAAHALVTVGNSSGARGIHTLTGFATRAGVHATAVRAWLTSAKTSRRHDTQPD